jgi:aminoglycoside phosphotransferase (APT) family kinase protein
MRSSALDAPAALAALGADDFTVVSKLSVNWHGDGHWLVRDPSGNRFSLRAVTFGREIRWEETRGHDLSVLSAQMDAADAFVAAGLPFMERAGEPAVVGNAFVMMFRWLDGIFAGSATPDRAFAMGQLLRRIHELALPVDDRLPEHDAAAAADRSVRELQDLVDVSFVERATEMVDRIRRAPARHLIVVHGDCNFPNILWSGDAVTGIVDFDQIGRSDPVEELAWVIKWWSRPRGIADLTHEPALAREVLAGYGEAGIDRDVLAAVLWVTGCLNANSVLHVLHAAVDARSTVLAALRTRADALAALVR